MIPPAPGLSVPGGHRNIEWDVCTDWPHETNLPDRVLGIGQEYTYADMWCMIMYADMWCMIKYCLSSEVVITYTRDIDLLFEPVLQFLYCNSFWYISILKSTPIDMEKCMAHFIFINTSQGMGTFLLISLLFL